jgi:hypothetical protein
VDIHPARDLSVLLRISQLDEGDDCGDERIAMAGPSTREARPGGLGLKAAWVLMLIVGLIVFSYGVAFLVAYAVSTATGSEAALIALEGGPNNIYVMKSDLATVFWVAIIITGFEGAQARPEVGLVRSDASPSLLHGRGTYWLAE